MSLEQRLYAAEGGAESISKGGISRRAFLKASAAAGGGLLLSFSLPALMRNAEAAETPTANTFAPNAFIRIDRQGRVTLVVHQVEMGQGTYTSLPMLLAEELEVDLAQVQVEPAPPDDKLYANPLLGFQATGGSTSVRGAWEPLRRAGAAARSMLVSAACATWNVDSNSCRAEKGEVIHVPTGRKLNYGALVDKAATLPVPDQVALKDPKDFKLIGTPAKRLDSQDKVNGKAQYSIDVKVPGMKIATVAACPVFGGKLAGVDEAKAKAIKGVHQVVRLDDAVAVVADHMWAAKQGLAALDIRWDEGPNAKLSTADIVQQLEAASQKPGVVARKESPAQGDMAKVMAGAAQKVEAIYQVPFLAHATMEPLNCTVHVRKDGCDVWVGTQVATRAQATAAQVTGLPPEKIRVHNHLLGGGFGRRLEVDFITQAVQIAKQVDGPVKVDLDPRRRHPARHLPALLLRSARRRPRRTGHADRLEPSCHRVLDPCALVAAGVQGRARSRCRGRCSGAALCASERPGGLRPSGAAGYCHGLVARCRTHAQHLRGGELHRRARGGCPARIRSNTAAPCSASRRAPGRCSIWRRRRPPGVGHCRRATVVACPCSTPLAAIWHRSRK